MVRPITRSVTKNMRENYDNIHKNGYHIYKKSIFFNNHFFCYFPNYF